MILSKGDLVVYVPHIFYGRQRCMTYGIVQSIISPQDMGHSFQYDIFWLHDGPPKTGFLYEASQLRLIDKAS
jgi:hypothetical protein